MFWLKKLEEVLIYAALERVFTSCLPNFRTTVAYFIMVNSYKKLKNQGE